MLRGPLLSRERSTKCTPRDRVSDASYFAANRWSVVREDTTITSSSVNADVTISISPVSARANNARTGTSKSGCSSIR